MQVLESGAPAMETDYRPRRAVVFAYHSVGARGLSVLLSLGLDVALVVSHEDDPGENLWFDSVRELSDAAGIPCIMPEAMLCVMLSMSWL